MLLPQRFGLPAYHSSIFHHTSYIFGASTFHYSRQQPYIQRFAHVCARLTLPLSRHFPATLLPLRLPSCAQDSCAGVRVSHLRARVSCTRRKTLSVSAQTVSVFPKTVTVFCSLQLIRRWRQLTRDWQQPAQQQQQLSTCDGSVERKWNARAHASPARAPSAQAFPQASGRWKHFFKNHFSKIAWRFPRITASRFSLSGLTDYKATLRPWSKIATPHFAPLGQRTVPDFSREFLVYPCALYLSLAIIPFTYKRGFRHATDDDDIQGIFVGRLIQLYDILDNRILSAVGS